MVDNLKARIHHASSQRSTKRHDEPLKILRDRRGKGEAVIRFRMSEGECRGVERLSPKEPRRVTKGLRKIREITVRWITYHWRSDRGHMHTDLMGTPRLERALNERSMRKALLHLPQRRRGSSMLGDRHNLAIRGVTPDRRGYLTFFAGLNRANRAWR